jgi:FPC/CPF motif-containing protein YcgG
VRVTSAAFERSVLASRASAEAKDKADFCPHCRSPFEIVIVKFRLNGTGMVATCPNCAIARVDEWRADNLKNLAITTRGIWHGIARMDSFDRRFRYVVAFLIGALITAAVLRHVLHVYGGITREEIRWDALMAVPAIALAIIIFRRMRYRK